MEHVENKGKMKKKIMMQLLIGCMEILFLKLAGRIALPKNTLPKV
jgi:hypothetical protein